ncbi:undecaprenyl-diphosphatase [Ectothiorhodosinus mongolicus]|uniref:undecaprenyl-diphosphate phosphatase n=1 Tax=Ectothiorhodosinus mongolicus TaxID=233100 RepID=A0A1R3VYU9_9GAMM|nr:phosphatase PAP2 family protein [Ectothiorhodosinus mongolicus]SIT69195.1 undecaprenyl-diphosphatase [Ectothiorhodosinus mongolicus]
MSLMQRLDAAELGLCLRFNRASQRWLIAHSFALISRLGNGLFWYVLMLAIPLVFGWQASLVSLHMGLVGLLCLPVYRILKAGTSRTRPCHAHGGIIQSVPPLDQFSFPSGHTMHAVAFTIILLAYLPAWGFWVLPFTLLVALSRLILGLHYPSDVLAGAAIGAGIALVSLWVIL